MLKICIILLILNVIKGDDLFDASNFDGSRDEQIETYVEDELEDVISDEPMKEEKPMKNHKIKVKKMPFQFENINMYTLELVLFTIIMVYITNFLYWSSVHQNMTTNWFNTESEYMDKFDTVNETESNHSIITKVSDNQYKVLRFSKQPPIISFLCSLKFVRRQDLSSLILSYLTNSKEELIYRVNFVPQSIDSFVFLLYKKRELIKIKDHMPDISDFCFENTKLSNELSKTYHLKSEIHDTFAVLFDKKIVDSLIFLNKIVDFLYFSDYYDSDALLNKNDKTVKTKDWKTTLIIKFSFDKSKLNLNNPSEEDIEIIIQINKLISMIITSLMKYKHNRDNKLIVNKNREKFMTRISKATHQKRQEVAMQKKDDKKRAERERILNIRDPDIEKKMQAKLDRKEKKKNQKFKVQTVRG
ncbi:Coiled-coil domain-containing protein 47 [Intoshia linei]|uniref:PAT complex subunit CCDC47 n=1 Tax=Intoshia linei TaxID=1819745 RepID=A0A177AXP2_9BILA|nr:Coiled-coil domain-containing protein 47 [Intoshia linei]